MNKILNYKQYSLVCC